MMVKIGTLWICENCMGHHANGECGDCHRDQGHRQPPLGLIVEPYWIAAGVDEHDCERGTVCDCEEVAYSMNACTGCGDDTHGPRHGVTLSIEETMQRHCLQCREPFTARSANEVFCSTYCERSWWMPADAADKWEVLEPFAQLSWDMAHGR